MQNPAKSKVYLFAQIGVMAAVLCVVSPFSIPLPGLVPITLATLVLYLSCYLLGWKKALLCCLVYLLLGLCGLPVFSGFGSGLAKLAGPTGGYLIGFLPMVAICGWFIERFPARRSLQLLGMILGTALLYLLGTIWLTVQTTDSAALFASVSSFWGMVAAKSAGGVLPFLPGDALKILLALLVGPLLRSKLQAARLLG